MVPRRALCAADHSAGGKTETPQERKHMPGRGPQSLKKRQKEQQRKERQQEKMAKRLERKRQGSQTGSDAPDADAGAPDAAAPADRINSPN